MTRNENTKNVLAINAYAKNNNLRNNLKLFIMVYHINLKSSFDF